MPVSEARKRANVEYNRRQDSITMRPKKQQGAAIRAAAAASGESLQKYILHAVQERMTREGQPLEIDSAESGELAVSEAHKKASYKYNASRDSITIRPERSKGAAIRAAAVASGKSLQNYILDALDARMEQEGRPLTLEEGAENEN